MAEEPLIAVFVDFENLALGVRDMKGPQFKVDLILKRLLEKGRIVYKRAYCDWKHYQDQVEIFHKQGISLVDIPHSKMSGKNSADIHMVCDALDLCYSKDHIDIFALLTGDSDFSPLVSKLKENNKRVVGCGVKNSTSNLLIANCDEFIYYDDLARALEKSQSKPRSQRGRKSAADSAPAKKDGKKAAEPEPEKEKGADRDAATERKPEAMDRLLEIIESLTLDYDPIWGSMIKQTLRRVYPGFNEAYMGYRNFGELLKHAESEAYISLEYDESRGNYKVTLLDY